MNDPGGKVALPLVYSCSGCGSAAQMANAVAVRLDREGKAEMSCIAGVGGGVEPILKLARSGRTILAVDGCPLLCVARCLAGRRLKPDLHINLRHLGVRNRYHQDFDEAEFEHVYHQIEEELSGREPPAPCSD